jgi:hypothetical protein
MKNQGKVREAAKKSPAKKAPAKGKASAGKAKFMAMIAKKKGC